MEVLSKSRSSLSLEMVEAMTRRSGERMKSRSMQMICLMWSTDSFSSSVLPCDTHTHTPFMMEHTFTTEPLNTVSLLAPACGSPGGWTWPCPGPRSEFCRGSLVSHCLSSAGTVPSRCSQMRPEKFGPLTSGFHQEHWDRTHFSFTQWKHTWVLATEIHLRVLDT